MNTTKLLTAATLAAGLSSTFTHAGGNHTGGIHAPLNEAGSTLAPLDIVHTKVTTHASIATFHMASPRRQGRTSPPLQGNWREVA